MSLPYQEEANAGVLRQIHGGERILDVGCGRGRLGEAMRARGNVVHGIELDPDAAHAAASRLDLVHCGDATEHEAFPEAIRAGHYDAVVCADVLEHTADPEALLRSLRRLLAPTGRIIVSLPNVAGWPIRARLLAGDFTYGDSGVLDRSHLRFFTRKTARETLEKTGFSVIGEDVTPYLVRAMLPILKQVLPVKAGPASIADSDAYKLYARHVEPVEAMVARTWPELLAFQIVLVAKARDLPLRHDGRIAVAMISRNEEAAVSGVMDELRAACPEAEVVLVDSSTDRTAQIARDKGAVVIQQIPPRGYGPAMQTALLAAAERADVVVTLDCDGTYPAESIPELARMVLEDGWDVVNASRLQGRPAAMPIPNWIANVTFAMTARLLHGVHVTDVHSGMRAYRSSVLLDVPFFAEAPALPVDLLIKPARLGYRVTEVPIEYRERIGETTLRRLDSTIWTFRRLFGLTGA